MNIFKQFFKSLYSPKDMASFRFQSIWKSILYVFLLALVSIVPVSFYITEAMNDGLTVVETTIQEDLPPFSIENGQLHSEVDETITVEKDNFTVIFDSSGDFEKRTLKKSKDTIALLKDEVIVIAGGQEQETPYTTFSAFTISSEDLGSLLAQLNSSLPLILVFTLFIFLFIGSGLKFMEVTLVALFGMLLRNLVGQQHSFKHMWTMAAYAVTIPTMFFTIMAALQTPVTNGFLINWTVSLIILFLILKEIPEENEGLKAQ